MRKKKAEGKRLHLWAAIYGVFLTGYAVFTLLDAFVAVVIILVNGNLNIVIGDFSDKEMRQELFMEYDTVPRQ